MRYSALLCWVVPLNDIARPDRQLGAIFLGLLLVFAIGTATYNWLVNRQLAADYAAVTRAYTVTRQIEAMMSRSTDGETGERGYLITGREEYLEPYLTFTNTIDGIYANLAELTADNPRQTEQVALLGPLLQARKKELRTIIELRRDGGLDAARASTSFDLGKALHDRIRAIVRKMNDEEWRTIGERNADVAGATRRSQRGMDVITLAVAILGAGIVFVGWRSKIHGSEARRAMQTAEADKQRLQEELNRNFELLASVGGVAKIGGWEVDTANGRLFWSPEVFKIHELDPGAQPSVERALDFYEPESRARIERILASSAKNGGSWDFEVPFITAKGRNLWVRTIGSVIVRDGVIVKIQGAFQDVTARKQTEMALKASTQLLDSIVENMPAMVVVKRADNLRYETLNRAGELLLGYSKKDVLGKSDYDLFPKDEAYKVVADDRRLLESGQTHDAPHESITRFNGEIRYASTRKVVLRNEANQPEHLLSISLDITQRRHADESMKFLNELLVSARDRAEAANQAKSDFLANMSHEIRTPMNAVLGMLQLLAQTELVHRQYDYVSKAQTAAKALLAILNDILDFSKIEAGKMSLDLRAFSLDELVRYVAVILSTSIGSKNVEAILDVDPLLPLCIEGDSLRLQQVLINLTGNAVKFTEAGEIVVSLKLVRMDDTSVVIEFSVRDTGIGIGPEHLGDIFKGFSQGETSTARRFGGTGLGLAISTRLVELMGATLQVESTVGVGSRFFFSMPFKRTEVHGTLMDERAATPISGMTANQILRVLVVDDNESTRQVLRAMIEALGWQADAVDSGARALTAMQQSATKSQAYDVVFMDWRMPGTDGWQTTKRIRETTDIGTPPIIIMISAQGREALADNLRDEPRMLDGFLIKPVTASMLFDAVADAKAGEAAASKTSAPRQVSLRLAGLRLLVVEDNLLNQQVAYELLSNEGAQVAVASNGRRGVEAALAAKPSFDAVLMDIQMPDIDGYTATAEIRRDDSMRGLPIIAMTANALAEDKAACLAAGMNDHIGKPIDLDVLVGTLLRHCRRVDLDWNTASFPTIVAVSNSAEPWTGAGVRQELDKALRRIGANRALFLKMAGLFAQSTATLSATLRGHLAREEIDEADRLLHTVIGTAGTVGMKQLADYIGRIKKKLRVSGAAAAMRLCSEEFDALIQQSCNALGAYAGALTPAAPAEIPTERELDESQVLKLLDALDDLMREKNMRATHVFDELRTTFGAALGGKLMDLESAMNDLDFPKSLRRSKSLRESLKC
jgi:PAS domain S-box-containing protein